MWTVAIEAAFLNAVCSRPAIWNTKCDEYHKRHLKSLAFHSVQSELRTMFLDEDLDEKLFSYESLRQKWNRMRAYKVKLHKERNFKKSGSEGGPPMKKWEHEDFMDFILDTIVPDSSVSNMDDISSANIIVVTDNQEECQATATEPITTLTEEFITNIQEYPFQNIRSSNDVTEDIDSNHHLVNSSTSNISVCSSSSPVPVTNFASSEVVQASVPMAPSSSPALSHKRKNTFRSEQAEKKKHIQKPELLDAIAGLTENISQQLAQKPKEGLNDKIGDSLAATILDVLNDKMYPISERRSLRNRLFTEVVTFMNKF